MLHLSFTPFPVLVTERLILRQLMPTDGADIFQLRTDKEVNKYVQHRIKTNTIADAQQFIQLITGNVNNNVAITWAITLKGEEKVIGTIVFWNISKEKQSGELGYDLLPAFHHKGIMQEALNTVLDFGFNTIKFQSVEAFTEKENTPSKKLLERNNFKRDSKLEKEIAGTEEGEYNIVYSRTK